jgi:hypothetical protein
LARSIKLCLVDNQQSSGITVVGFESCWFKARLSTSSSPQIEFTNYVSEDRAWTSSIDIKDLRFTARYNLVCPRFIFAHYLQSTKSPKNSLIFTVLSPIVPCNFVFRFALLSFCLWLSLVAGFDCVHRRSSFAPLLFLVSATILSTISKQQVEATTLLDLPPLAALCDLSPPL